MIRVPFEIHVSNQWNGNTFRTIWRSGWRKRDTRARDDNIARAHQDEEMLRLIWTSCEERRRSVLVHLYRRLAYRPFRPSPPFPVRSISLTATSFFLNEAPQHNCRARRTYFRMVNKFNADENFNFTPFAANTCVLSLHAAPNYSTENFGKRKKKQFG